MVDWNYTHAQWNYEEAMARAEIEFHFWIDQGQVDEEALHSQWLFMTLRRWYPGVRAETINEAIHRMGWH